MRPRLLVQIAIPVAAALCASPLASQTKGPADAVISRVNVIDTDGGRTMARTVVVRDGAIAALLTTGAPLPDARVTIDGRGKFLIPGLWDMHVHLATVSDAAFAERTMLPLFLAHGVVGVRDMGGPLDRVLALREGVAGGKLQGPRIITPGPFIDGPGEADPMFRRVTTVEEARGAVRDLAQAGVDFVKVQANLTRETYDAVTAEARARKLAVAGHVPIALQPADVIAAGQRSIEHISPALVGDGALLFACSRRANELHDELLAIERDRATASREQIAAREANLRAELVRTFDPSKAAALGANLSGRQTWIVPTLIWSKSLRPVDRADSNVPLDLLPPQMRKRLQDGRARYLTSASPEALQAAADTAAIAARAMAALHTAGARVLAGTDTYDGFVIPGFSLHQELALFVGAGLTTMEALQAATRNAAEFRGALEREGTITRGKRADMVLLDANPLLDIRNLSRINAVFMGGRVLTRSDLDTLLSSLRAADR
jgi:imidazolonepropionase-like amidohydrolase